MGGGNYTSVPTILLKGKWLEEAGFKMGGICISKQSLEDKINGLDRKQLKDLNAYLDSLKK